MNFSPHELKEGELKELSESVSYLSKDPGLMMAAWNQLDDFFSKNQVLDDVRYQKTFFKWYVLLSFRNLKNLSYDFITEMFHRQMFTAMCLDLDPQKELISYLYFKTLNDDDLIKLYEMTRNSVLNSEAILGQDFENALKLKDVVEMVKKWNVQADSIKIAEGVQKIAATIFVDKDETIILKEKDLIVDELIGIINFFLGVKPEDVVYVVNSYYENNEIPGRSEIGEIKYLNNKINSNQISELSKSIQTLSKPEEKKPDVNKSEIKIEVSSVPVQKPEVRSSAIVQASKPAAPFPQPVAKKEEPKLVEVKKEEIKITLPPKPEIKPAEVKPEPKPEPKKIEVKLPEVKKEEKKPESKPVIKPIEKKPEAKPDKTEDPMFFLSKKAPQPPKKEVKKESVKEENLQAPKALQQAATPKKADIFAPVDPGKRHLTYKEIRRQIESRFPKDKTGHFLNIVDVMHELERIGHDQGDLKVRDLYYFNEQTGSFEWNENLLKD